MRGVSSLESLCEAARAQGADTLALTDTNGFYGAIRFLEVARQVGLRPILGAELTHEDAAHARVCHRAVLLAKTAEGYANLCRLLSARHCDASFEFIPAVARYRTGLIVLSDDLPALTAWKRASPEDLYVELTPGAMMHEALAFSRRTGLPPVATNRVHFVRPEEWTLHRLLRAIALNTTLSRLPPEACCASRHWLAPATVLERQFPHVPHALANTRRIAEACRTDWDFKDTIFPAFRQLSDRQAFAWLREKTEAGAAWRYGTITPAVRQRIEQELAVIEAKRYAHYFLVVEEIVRDAPLTCGRGSAAASIVAYCLGITHVDPIRHNLFFERFLNLGRHDPPDIDLDFPWDERDRVLDRVFARYGTERAAMVANQNSLAIRAALREVAKVSGLPPAEIGRATERILRHATFLRLEQALAPRVWAQRLSRELALREPWPEILGLAVHLEGHFRHLALHCGGIVIVPDDIRRYVPVEVAAKGVPVIQWEKDQTEDAGLVKIDLLGNRSLAVIRDALEAIAQHTGRRLDYATWDPLSDAATQDLIRRGETMGCFYIESPATRLLLKKLWTGMPAALWARADVFEYLVIVSSLIRPAANRFIREFVRRAHGGAYRPLHPVLEQVLADTYGIMVYQEDVTKVAMALAGFSLEDADQLRKVLSKKHKQRQLHDYRRQFLHGAAARGAAPAAIEAIWAMIMSFAGYSFCKPHSASYAQVSFKSAYLRAHYPAEFMAAVLSNQGGFYSTFAYVSESRRMGLTILPPDINASAWAFTGTGSTIRVGLMQTKTLTHAFAEQVIAERAARGPFRSFREFLERVHPEPAQARVLIKAGCFDSIAGDVTRPGLLWRLLAHPSPHPSPPKGGEGWGEGSFRGTGTGADAGASPLPQHLPIPPEYPESRRLQEEIETLGFPLSRHPLELYGDSPPSGHPLPGGPVAPRCNGSKQRVRGLSPFRFGRGQARRDAEPVPANMGTGTRLSADAMAGACPHIQARDMARYVGQRVTMLGWLITSKGVETKDGDPMEFVSFEDTTALYDATVFPDAYRRYYHLLSSDRPYLLEGLIEEDFGTVTLTVHHVQCLALTPTVGVEALEAPDAV
jgi:error-prone DNA polymerase